MSRSQVRILPGAPGQHRERQGIGELDARRIGSADHSTTAGETGDEMSDSYQYVGLVAMDQYGLTQLMAPPHIVKEGTDRTFCGLTAARFEPVAGNFLLGMACGDCKLVIARLMSGEGGF
jgi:hypothetical protein